MDAIQRLNGLIETIQRDRVHDDQASLGRAFKELVQHTSDTQKEAGESAEQYLATGEGELHEVQLGLAKADVTFRFLVEVRNKLTEAYQEINRMPV